MSRSTSPPRTSCRARCETSRSTPSTPRRPPPAALWAGDRYTVVDGQVPYAQPPAYNGYTKFSGGIEGFPAYEMTLVPKQGTAFNGISSDDQAKMQAYPTHWDGRLIGNLPTEQSSAFKVVQKGPTSINVNVPASLLRPGRHTPRNDGGRLLQGCEEAREL